MGPIAGFRLLVAGVVLGILALAWVIGAVGSSGKPAPPEPDEPDAEAQPHVAPARSSTGRMPKRPFTYRRWI